MALYSGSDLDAVELWYRGKPFINVEASVTANTQTNARSSKIANAKSYIFRHGLFYGALGALSTTAVKNIYYKVGGVWTLVSNAYVYIGTSPNGVWKNVVDDVFYVKTPSGWRRS